MQTKTTTDASAGGQGRAKARTPIDPFAAPVEPKISKPGEPLSRKKTAKKAVKTEAVKAAPKVKAEESVPLVKTEADDPFRSVADIAAPVKEAAPVKARSAKVAPKARKAVKAAPKAAKPVKKTAKAPSVSTAAAATPAVERSPAFTALAEPVMPVLKKENRARLQMQTPTRLYFYWTAKQNPWTVLQDAFGETGSYQLVLKLNNLDRETETMTPADPEGNYWFDVEPGSRYRAEIGFYAPNRPYFRVIYSNTVETPRRSPSPRTATEADWRISANKFAEVLDVAGFSRDAFDVALAGDDAEAAETVTQQAFTRFVGKADYDLAGISAEEIRYAMLALASGLTLVELRGKISPLLLSILEENAGELGSGKAMSALTEYFDIDESEFVEESMGPGVFGASLMHFPRTLRSRGLSPKQSARYSPLSSHSFR